MLYTEDGEAVNIIPSLFGHLELLNIWPKYHINIKFCIKFFCCIMMTRFSDVGLIGYLIHTTRDEIEVQDLAEPLMGLSSSISISIYSLICVYKNKLLRYMFIELASFREVEKPNGFDSLNKRLNFISEFLIIACIVMASGVCLFFVILHCEEGVLECDQMYRYYVSFVDLNVTPNRQVLAMLQIIPIYFLGVFGTLYGWSVLAAVLFIENRINHLIWLFKKIPNMDKKYRRNFIKKCVLYHYKIIDLVDMINELYTPFLDIHVPLSTVVITFSIYHQLVHFKVQMFLHAMLWVGNVTMTCIIGERLVTSSSSLNDAIYKNLPWDEDIETQKSMLLMYIGSKKPLSLHGGLNGSCDHLQLMEICRTAYSFITLLGDME